MTSEIETLIRVATGEPINREDVLRMLYRASACDKSESRRHENHARRRLRNAALLKAAELLGADEPGAWRLAERLEVAVERFQTRVWPRLKAGGHCDLLSPVDCALHQAFLTGEHIPSTQRRIYEILLT